MSDHSLTGVDAGTLAVWEQNELAIDQLTRALAAVRRLGDTLDGHNNGWALQSCREIAEVAVGAAEMICAEALHLEAVKTTSVDYVRGAS